MAVVSFHVAAEGGRWKLCSSFFSRWYENRVEALRCAIDSAHQAATLGNVGQVTLRAEDGAERRVWRSDQDGYPPAESLLRGG